MRTLWLLIQSCLGLIHTSNLCRTCVELFDKSMTNPRQIYRLNPLVKLDSNSSQVYDALLDDLTQVRVASDDGFVSS